MVNEEKNGRTTKAVKLLPVPREFASRTYSPQVSLREGVTTLVESLMMDFETLVIATADSYGDDELNINDWTVFQHRSQSEKALNVLNELRSVVAEIEATLKAEALTYLRIALGRTSMIPFLGMRQGRPAMVGLFLDRCFRRSRRVLIRGLTTEIAKKDYKINSSWRTGRDSNPRWLLASPAIEWL